MYVNILLFHNLTSTNQTTQKIIPNVSPEPPHLQPVPQHLVQQPRAHQLQQFPQPQLVQPHTLGLRSKADIIGFEPLNLPISSTYFPIPAIRSIQYGNKDKMTI